MSDLPHPLKATSTANPTRVFVVLAIYLIATFLWRALTPAHEYSMRTEQVMTIAFDLLCVISLIWLNARLSSATAADQPEWTTGKQVRVWLALLAGLGLLAIRLMGDASWWTGHISFELRPPPR